ncbi:MAG: aminotransferase class V-fold PLP-dependent enzyme, partial [Deltaproteobacteria bacterium]|nr:aminotransferase class V-fold PLP-dependent enzyme [Deltaproteobacteria bacterium]
NSGDLLPAKELCALARSRGVISLVDGAQTFGVLDVNLGDMQPDFYSGSAHKWVCGPKENGVLYIKGEGHEARIFLRQGKVYYALIDDNHELGPSKSFYRIVRWEKGDFELLPPDTQEFMVEMEEPTEVLLMEGLRQLDELRRIEKDLPPTTSGLTLAMPLASPLRDLKPEQLDLVQLVHNEGLMQTVLDKSDASDLDTCTALLELVTKGYVKPAS